MSKKPRRLFFIAIPVLFPLLFAPLTSCVMPDRSTPQSLFDRARRDMAAGRYRRAAAEFGAFIETGGGKIPAVMLARGYKLRGDCNRNLKEYALARLDYAEASRIAGSLGAASPEGRDIALESATARGDTYLYQKSYRIADKLFAELLAKAPSPKYRDPLLYRRYICALKLGLPHPERFTGEIENINGFDVARLRREFLGHNGPLLTVPLPLEDRTSLAGGSMVRIIPRSAWHAAPTRSNVDPMTTIRRITIHHSGVVWTSTDYAATAARIRYYQEFHQDDRGWADIGYHFIIDRCGRIWEGRELRFQGAHAGNASLNRGNIGICVMGDYDVQRLDPRQKKSLLSLLSLLCREYGLKPRQIVTHEELKSTACPGKNLQAFIEAARRGTAP